MNFFKFMYLLPCWSFSNAVPAIFFEFGEKKLVEISTYAGEEICYSCMNACPVTPNSPTLKLLNDNISITGNGIFSKDIYPEHTDAKNMRTDICENRYTPALVFDNVLKSFDVGYELYYKENEVKLTCSWYVNYCKVVDGKGIDKWKEPRRKDLIKMYREGNNTVFQLVDEPEVKYIFYWIKVLTIEMSNGQKHRLVTYAPDIINDLLHGQKIEHKCEIYYSGDGRTISDKNSQKQREQIINGNSLVRAQIIPMYMFHTAAARLATCMYLNFAFVWETIAKNQLKKIDLFLYALFREWPLVTYLAFGINDNLQDMDPIAWNGTTSEDRIFKSTVPKVLFRFIQIHLGNSRHYGAAVAVHNYLEPVQDTDRICSAEEELNSWDYLKNTNSATGFSYVCPLTNEVVKKLKGNEKSELERSQPLNITEFPILNRATKQVSHENVLERIKKRFQDIKDMILD